MRLIDADKLEELCDIMAEKCGDIGESIWNQFRTTVECSPTIDAVPVVRCKDCRWKLWTHCTRFENAPVTNEDYCSKGERRAANENR